MFEETDPRVKVYFCDTVFSPLQGFKNWRTYRIAFYSRGLVGFERGYEGQQSRDKARMPYDRMREYSSHPITLMQRFHFQG
jgi:hypothetical protein